MTIITRQDWRARPAKSSTGITQVLGVAGHWEGVKIGPCNGSQCYERIRSIQAYHMDQNGWADIAYSMVVCTCGNIFIGRGPTKRTAANGTNEANARWYAICVLMGPGDTFTDAAKHGFLEARQYLIDHGSAGPAIAPHRQFFQTQCPGDQIAEWIADGSPNPEEVQPMFNPPFPVVGLVVDFLNNTDGPGGWMLTDAGAVYAFGGAQSHGGANGQPYFKGRKASRLVCDDETRKGGHHYTIVAASRERYDY